MPRYTTSDPWSEAGLGLLAAELLLLLLILDRFSEVSGLVAEEEPATSFLLVTRSLETGLMFTVLRAEGLVSELTAIEPLLGKPVAAVSFRAKSICATVMLKVFECA